MMLENDENQEQKSSHHARSTKTGRTSIFTSSLFTRVLYPPMDLHRAYRAARFVRLGFVGAE